MSQRNVVGQTTSNAIRSYNRIINNVSEQCEKFKELGHVLGEDLHMAVVFSTRNGFIKYLGATKITDVISRSCGEDLLVRISEKENIVDASRQATLLKLPAPVSQLNAKTLQNIIPTTMKNVVGGGYIKWGKASSKPEWWPEQVVFANIKQRPKEQDDGRKWVDCLRDVLSAMYRHYGYDAEKHVNQNSDTDIDNTCLEYSNSDSAEGYCTDATNVESTNAVSDHHDDDITNRIDEYRHCATAGDRPEIPDDEEHLANINNDNRVIPEGNSVDVGHSDNVVRNPDCLSVANRDSVPGILSLSPVVPIDPMTGKRKRNWDDGELNDPIVREFVNYMTPKKRRIIKPRNMFTPSAYS